MYLILKQNNGKILCKTYNQLHSATRRQFCFQINMCKYKNLFSMNWTFGFSQNSCAEILIPQCDGTLVRSIWVMHKEALMNGIGTIIRGDGKAFSLSALSCHRMMISGKIRKRFLPEPNDYDLWFLSLGGTVRNVFLFCLSHLAYSITTTMIIQILSWSIISIPKIK